MGADGKELAQTLERDKMKIEAETGLPCSHCSGEDVSYIEAKFHGVFEALQTV